MTISLAIPHCRFDPHRVRSLASLKSALEIRNDRDECDRAKVAIFPSVGPTPNWVWSAQVFEHLAAQDSEWSMLIQDDVIPIPGFWAVVTAAIEGAAAAGAEAFCFFTIVPPAGSFSKMGCNWVTTTDWMVGPCWAVRTSAMREFVEFRKTRLRAGWNSPGPDGRLKSGLNEDTQLGLFLAATGRKIWHPLPSLVDHDVEVPSTYGNGGFAFNKSSFGWKDWSSLHGLPIEALRDRAFWMPRNPPATGVTGAAPHLGRAYSFTAQNFLRWIVDDGGAYGDLPWDGRYEQLARDIVKVEVQR